MPERDMLTAMAEKMKTLEEGISSHGPLTENELLYVATKVAKYLAALHKLGKFHLKSTPSNLFVDGDGNLQMEEGGGGSNSSAVHRLTLGFNAPEVLLGEEASARTDIYKTGLLLQYLASKEWPYKTLKRADDLSRIYSEAPFEQEPPLSEAFSSLVKRCQSRDPEERLADGSALSKELDKLVALKFGGGQPPNLRRWLAGRPFPKSDTKWKQKRDVTNEQRGRRNVERQEPSFSALPVLIPVVLAVFLVLFVLLQPKEQVHIDDIRLRFVSSGVVVTGQYPLGKELTWKLDQSNIELRVGKTELKTGGKFSILVDGLTNEGVYVLSFLRNEVLLGQMGFSLPKGRYR